VGGPGTPPFGARGKSSVRYGARLGDLKNKHSTHTLEIFPPLWPFKLYSKPLRTPAILFMGPSRFTVSRVAAFVALTRLEEEGELGTLPPCAAAQE
jgi:hypothetical protein